MLKITVNMLQSPTVICQGVAITFPVRRADALLYYMICNKSAARDELVSLLWDNCDNKTGYKNLRNTLYALKKSLGYDVLISPRKTSIQLNPELEIDCDYLRFMEQDDYEAYQGPFLHGFSLKNAILFEEWLEQMREKTREQYLRFLLSFAYQSAERNDIQQAEQYALEYLKNDPLDEQMAAFLINLYRNSRMYPKITRVYQRLRECLDEELGIAPLAETTALYYQAINEWNDMTTADDNAPEDYVPPSRSELIAGMTNEIRLFLSQSGKNTSFILRGESGMGKTFLLENCLARLDFSTILALKSNCYQSEAKTSYRPWESIMITIAEYLYSHGILLPDTVRRTIADIFPIFAFGSEPLTPSATPPDEKAVTECVLLLMSMLSRHVQVLLVFEDILWMDAYSMNLLSALLRHTSPGQIMIIVTSRDILPSRSEAVLRALIEDKLLNAITLERLTEEDVAAMTQVKTGLELPEQVVQRIHNETGGNPALLCELISGITDYSSVETLLFQSRHLLDRRLIGLSTSARQLLDIIALFPGPAPCNMLASIYSKGADELLNASEELKRRGLVVEQLLDHGNSNLTITYTRLHDMLYQQQSYFKRRPLHLRIARLLAQQTGDLTIDLCERLSYHFMQANDAENALAYEITRFLLLAELFFTPFPALPDGEEIMDYEAPTTKELFELEERAKELQQKLGENQLSQNALNQLMLARILMSFSRGDSKIALTTAEQLFYRLEAAQDHHKLLFAYRLLSLYHRSMFDIEQLDVYLSLGANLSDKIDDKLASAYFCWLRGERHSLAGKYNESNYFLTEALDRFTHLHDAERYRLPIAGVHQALGLNEQRQGDIAAACSYYKQALNLTAEAGAYKGVAQIYIDYGRAALAIGDNAKARGLFSSAWSLCEKTADLPAIAMAGAYMALLAADDFEIAADLLTQARKAAIQAGTPLEQGVVYGVMAQLRQKLDMEKKYGNALDRLLNSSLDAYCRKGLHFLDKTDGTFERETLTACLRYSTTKARPFTAPELYSKNKQFMTE